MTNFVNYQDSEERANMGQWTQEVASFLPYQHYTDCLRLVTEDSFTVVVGGETFTYNMSLSEEQLTDPAQVASCVQDFIDRIEREQSDAKDHERLVQDFYRWTER